MAAVAELYAESFEPSISDDTAIVAPGPRRNAMSGQMQAVDIILAEWGRWMRNADKVLGWQTCNILGKVRVEGLNGAAQATAPTELPDGIMVTDAAIAKLSGIRREVIKICYMRYPNASMDSQRRKLNMSRSRWSYLLKDARCFVAAALGIPQDEK